MYTLYNIRQTLCGLIKGIICLWHGRNTCKQIFILCTTQIAFTASIKKYETVTKKTSISSPSSPYYSNNQDEYEIKTMFMFKIFFFVIFFLREGVM